MDVATLDPRLTASVRVEAAYQRGRDVTDTLAALVPLSHLALAR